MASISQTLLAAALFAAPVTNAMAQTNPAGNYGSNRSTTAAPDTADSKAGSGMKTGDIRSGGSAGSYPHSAADPRTPGGTGRTMVPGSNSSQASAASGSANTRTDATTGGGK